MGLAPDQYVFSSELYGLVEGTPWFVKMDGEAPADPDMLNRRGRFLFFNRNRREDWRESGPLPMTDRPSPLATLRSSGPR